MKSLLNTLKMSQLKIMIVTPILAALFVISSALSAQGTGTVTVMRFEVGWRVGRSTPVGVISGHCALP